jgi:HSP20 family protein
MTRNPTDWMWAQAVAMLEQAERAHRQFFRLATSERTHAIWEPPIDVFEDDREIIIVVAVPGVRSDRIEVSAEGGELVVRAEAPLPFIGAQCAIRQLEIPYGFFERRIRLPNGLQEGGTRELRDGCLILTLRKSC